MNLLTIPGMVKAIKELQARVAELEKQPSAPVVIPTPALKPETAPETPLPAPRRGRPPKVAQEVTDGETTI